MRHSLKPSHILIGWALIISSCFVASTVLGYFSGQWLPSYDADITAFGFCNKDGHPYQSDINVETIGGSLYVCGELQGTTFLPIVLYIFHEQQALIIRSERLTPGQFAVLVPETAFCGGYLPGRYRTIAIRSRLTIAEASLNVTGDAPC